MLPRKSGDLKFDINGSKSRAQVVFTGKKKKKKIQSELQKKGDINSIFGDHDDCSSWHQ